jgi:hypothetical protein
MKKFTCCGNREEAMNYRWQVFANQTMHIICHCVTCGRYLGHVPQISPYTSLVKGNYQAPNKKPVAVNVGSQDASIILAAIISIPGIEKVIGSLLYREAKKNIK